MPAGKTTLDLVHVGRLRSRALTSPGYRGRLRRRPAGRRRRDDLRTARSRRGSRTLCFWVERRSRNPRRGPRAEHDLVQAHATKRRIRAEDVADADASTKPLACEGIEPTRRRLHRGLLRSRIATRSARHREPRPRPVARTRRARRRIGYECFPPARDRKDDLRSTGRCPRALASRRPFDDTEGGTHPRLLRGPACRPAAPQERVG